MMGIFCSLLCCGLLSSGCTHLVECGRTSSLITVKINYSSSHSYSRQKWDLLSIPVTLEGVETPTPFPLQQSKGNKQEERGHRGQPCPGEGSSLLPQMWYVKGFVGSFHIFQPPPKTTPFFLFSKPLRKGFGCFCFVPSCLSLQRVPDPSVDNIHV